ncbi:MAG: zinc finger domain-containing protein, partial [Candidatus Berkelbacteria bacterium]
IFDFADGSKLFFNDMRRFGWVKLLDSQELKLKLSEELGVEPFDSEFTAEELSKIIKSKPRWNIKKVLTDQSLISGIGNIYVDESLYWAGILPTRLAGEISDDEISKLRESIIKSLEIGLKYGGSSENTYYKIDGTKGQAQEHFQVYAQEGKSCKRCDGIIKKIRLNGRGTHFCSECQK